MGKTMCEMCGDVGAQNALVFCVKCLDCAIHRYCLNVQPQTLDEFVRWFCADCEEKYGKPYPSKEASSVPSSKRGRITAEKSNGYTLRPHKIQNKRAESDKIVRDHPPKGNTSRSKNKSLIVRHAGAVTNQEELLCEGNNENIVSEGKKLCIVGADVARKETDSQIVLVSSSTVPEANERIFTHPVIDPIWRGSFNIETDGYGVCDGLVAHLSSQACSKVWEEAKLFSESLCMELVPKASVWPKSFQKSEPSDDSIALYFFALNESVVKDLDDLVSEMMCKDLALRAVVTNAQLLVFTSNELPLSYWKIKGKFYLWGVFMQKQAALSSSANCQVRIQPLDNGEDGNTNMSLDSLSPISPLSNISNSGLRWMRPDAGELKLNVAAIFNDMEDTNTGAIGGLIRNHDGEWVYGFYMYVEPFKPETAHLFSIFNGLEIAKKIGICKLTLESDSKNVVEAVCSARMDNHLQHYIEAIRDLMQKDWLCRLKWINTEANTCANKLTLEAFSTMTTNELAKPPEFMLSFLNADRDSSCNVV